MSVVESNELLRVLERAKSTDDLGQKIAKAIELIEGVLDDLGEQAVAISFNGGKDCTVLLHLLSAVLYARHASIPSKFQPSHARISIPPDTSHTYSPPTPIAPQPTPTTTSTTYHAPSTTSNGTSLHPPIRAIYITAPNPFPTLEQFVQSSIERYHLDLYRFGGGMKAALSEYLGGGGSGVRGVLVGTRRGDPNGDVDELAPTDPSWPPFLRIHPILHWSYTDIWQFLRELDVHWCALYDQGYTSLGSTTNTEPNPVLKNGDGWEPAWKLVDGSQERAGRK